MAVIGWLSQLIAPSQIYLVTGGLLLWLAAIGCLEDDVFVWSSLLLLELRELNKNGLYYCLILQKLFNPLAMSNAEKKVSTVFE